MHILASVDRYVHTLLFPYYLIIEDSLVLWRFHLVVVCWSRQLHHVWHLFSESLASTSSYWHRDHILWQLECVQSFRFPMIWCSMSILSILGSTVTLFAIINMSLCSSLPHLSSILHVTDLFRKAVAAQCFSLLNKLFLWSTVKFEGTNSAYTCGFDGLCIQIVLCLVVYLPPWWPRHPSVLFIYCVIALINGLMHCMLPPNSCFPIYIEFMAMKCQNQWTKRFGIGWLSLDIGYTKSQGQNSWHSTKAFSN